MTTSAPTILRVSASLFCLTVLGALGAGCTASTDDPPAEAEASEDALTAREGYAKLPPLNGDVYVSVAVSGKKAFLGDNFRTLRVYDLATRKITKTYGERIPTDSLSVSGNTLAVCGERQVDSDRPSGDIFGSTDSHFEINLLDAKTLAKKRTVSLNLEPYLSTLRDQIRDKPNLRCRIDGSTITVSFSQQKLKHEVVSFPVPSADAVYDFRTIPGATRIAVTPSAGTREGTVSSFTTSAAGLTLASGGWGIRRLAPNARSLTSLRDVGREHIVDVAASGAALFAADHDGALLVLDDATGRELARVEIPDWVEGLAMADGYVVVIGREGIFVQKDTWSRAR
ncbi:MAG: hypothetical protein JST00_24130 [Deltaproteobacteria bacterium]|nr:hypothetical protein [Deltaproteobacteria bacterium]